MLKLACLTAFVAAFISPAAAELTPRQRADVALLIERAMTDERAYDLVASLTTEVGPRLGGTDAEARARTWGEAKLKALGFKNVRTEPFDMPVWTRISESASIVSPFSQPLHVTALGNSVSTATGGIEADVVRFATLTALQQAPKTGLEGKIVFVDERMTRTQDGSGYSVAVAKRSGAANEASKRGAAAAIIRSVGTDSHRFPHTGNMNYAEGVIPIPTAALSNPDADILSDAIRRAKGPVRLKLDLRTQQIEKAQSGNVVGEIPGRSNELIVVGGHLDSWDLGTGAVDDASGIAITVAAAKLVDELKGQPGRTIRIVMWGAEEVGIHGGKAYAERHKDDLTRHVLAAESDFGAGRVWQLRTHFGAGREAYAKDLADALRPLGVGPGGAGAFGGADVGSLRAAGVPVLDLAQDGSDYFDFHHTANDTFDKIDPEALKQNVAAWAVMLYLAGEFEGGFRAVEAAAP
ncbi:MAG: M20/M25/M40 family metallo-hydrolase [Parvularculaceae bacterium]|nr:M20/M25/M40 family metallo-hydrolase [Parvularculaceae bacterium]